MSGYTEKGNNRAKFGSSEKYTDNEMQSICTNGNDASLVLVTNAGVWTPLLFAINFGDSLEVVDALRSASGGEGAAFLAAPLTFFLIKTVYDTNKSWVRRQRFINLWTLRVFVCYPNHRFTKAYRSNTPIPVPPQRHRAPPHILRRPKSAPLIRLKPPRRIPFRL
uniref:Uncharacterized protein n=1 Tax=Proboscia inermis TaxID=420281 RepID=A0A7S0C568_9STRA